MAWSEPIALSHDRRLFADPELWNTYIKDNLSYLYDHHAADDGVHGLGVGVYPLGLAQFPGGHIEWFTSATITTEGTHLGGGTLWFSATWEFTKPFASNPIVLMDIERVTGNPATGCYQRVGGVTRDGVELRGFTLEKDVQVRFWGLAIGRQTDAEGGLTNQLAWTAPKTAATGDKWTYADWLSQICDDPNFIKRNHLDLSNQVHGLAPGIHVLGHEAAGHHIEAQRWPAGDVGTQQTAQTADVTFTFLKPFAAAPVVVTS